MKKLVLVFLLALALCHSAPARAAPEYTVVRHLNFGAFSIARNTDARTIVVEPDDVTLYDPGIYPDVQARAAVYDLTGFPPNMTITLGVYVATPPSDGGLRIDNSSGLAFGAAPPFTVSNFTCNNPTTDNDGNATLMIGATLTTDGLGGYYDTGSYTGTIDLTFYLE